MVRHHRLLGIVLVCMGLACGQLAYAKMYRWVDEDGNVHFSDRVPPAHSKHKRDELDEYGRVRGSIGPQKTEEEIKKHNRRMRAAEEERKRQEAQARHDRILLDTFTNERELELTREERIASVESLIRLTEDRISEDQVELESLEMRTKDLEANGKPVPAHTAKKLANVREALIENQEFLQQKKLERQRMIKRFEADLQRFRELKGIAAKPTATPKN